MSAFLLGMGFRADMGTCIRKLVLLKLIDACEDDGTRIFPAIATVARAAQCSDRQVQREIKAFVEIGLLRMVREGGKGRRSTNEYAMDLDVLAAISRAGWDAFVAARAKGDTQSPLEAAAKGDSSDTDRVTGETPKGDNACHTTPPDPSLDPSISREARASEQDETERREPAEDRKAVERAFWRVVKDWPGFAGMPKEPAKAAWFALAPDERTEAERRLGDWLALLKAQRKSHVPAPSTYFREKLWSDVPEPEADKPTALEAKPFGPLWQAVRIKHLLAGPTAPVRLTTFQRMQIQSGQADEATVLREGRARHGFPSVNLMHERALDRRGVAVAPELEALTAMMEPVPVGSERYEEWRFEHEHRGWPWIPDPGAMRVVYFPHGGPAALNAFEEAIDQTAREAAE